MSYPLEKFPNKRVAAFDDLAEFLKIGYSEGYSDFHLHTGRPLLAKRHGQITPLPGTTLSVADMSQIIDHDRVYGSNGVSELASGKAPNTSIQVRIDRNTEVRFRVQAKSCLAQGRRGYHLAIRVINSEPANFEMLEVEQELIDHCMPPDGMVLTCGPTGSGKTTLLSATIRALVEPEDANRIVLTFEDPIEYVYDSVVMPSSAVIQTEIPSHLANYADALPAAVRSDPDVIVINEMKDIDTIAAACDAAMTGHALYATGHAKSVAAAIARFVNVFPASERQGRSVDLLQALHLVIAQRLLPRKGGGMVGVREWLVFTDEIKQQLLKVDPSRWAGMVADLVQTDGRSMKSALDDALQAGKISESQHFVHTARGRAAA